MKYSILLEPHALAAVHRVIARHGTIDVVLDARQLIAQLAFPRDECVVLDPALISPQVAESIATRVAEFPRAMVAYSSTTAAALESGIILARRTSARFVFRGTPNEQSALQRALLLTPNSELGSSLLVALAANLDRLPPAVHERVGFMFRVGDGPGSPDALAAAVSITRRSLERRASDAGFASVRAIIEAARVAWAYRAITSSAVPLGRIAAMLGYTSSRTMDQQIRRMIDVTAGKLRQQPLSVADATERLVQHLIVRGDVSRANAQTAEDIKASLKLIDGGARSRRGYRHIPNQREINP